MSKEQKLRNAYLAMVAEQGEKSTLRFMVTLMRQLKRAAKV